MRSDLSFNSAAYFRAVSTTGIVCQSSSRLGVVRLLRVSVIAPITATRRPLTLRITHGFDVKSWPLELTMFEVTMGYLATCMNLRACSQP